VIDTPYLRLGLATVAGAVIGAERTLDRKPAGLRTYALVSLGAAAMLLAAGNESASTSRVMQGIVTGIGFLGAGSILRTDRTVHGLTSAASIWLAAALGMTAGTGQYALTIYLVVLTLVVLVALRWLENRWKKVTGKTATEA
jgi:putative Mg2+ transporter-C (MgtC) family protein